MTNIALISLGCAKNLVDSELILGRLAADGYRVTNQPAEAEIIIVNTCGFIGAAKEEAIKALLDAARWKQEGRCRLLVAAGCLVQRHAGELAREMPEIDLFITRAHYRDLAQALARAAEQPGLIMSGAPETDFGPDWPRLLSTPPHRAYLRIADGCDNRCSYCVIPSVRGAYRSRPPAEIVAEAEVLAAKGVQEVTIIAQDTTAYGHDLPGKPSLSGLLRALLRVEGPRWWRLLYTYPTRISRELMELMAAEERICRYLDLPLQHAASSVLKDMGRPADAAATRALLEDLRRHLPGLALRTSLIVGFPGESEAAFAELRAFIAEQRFHWLGVFAYSREEGTAAASMPGQVPARIKEARRRELLGLQQEISREILRQRVGSVFPVLIEGPHPERPGYWLARSEAEAPEVDGRIHVPLSVDKTGQFIMVRAVKAGTYDLEALPEPVSGRS